MILEFPKASVILTIGILCAVSVNLLGVPVVQSISSWYTIYVLTVSIFLLKTRDLFINWECILFLFAAAFSITFNSPDAIYRSWERLCFLFCILLITSPLIYYDKLNKWRQQAFNATMVLFIAIAAGSFLCYCIGLNYSSTAARYGVLGIEETGYFGGLTKHSMLLGPVSGIACCTLLTKYLLRRKGLTLILLFLCFASLLLSASRAAFISFLISSLYIFFSSELRIKLAQKITIITILCISLLLSALLFSSMMVDKQASSGSHDLFSSRSELWNARLTEFMDSPLLGCGFASEKIVRSVGILAGGILEPGTSWGAIFAQIGLLGGVPIVILWLKVMLHISKYKNEEGIIITSTAIFFAIHMCTEGYFLAAGNVLCLVAWLTLGVAYMYEKT